MTRQQIPVILDTDIGGDIDDTWALAMLLNSPELDIKLITTATDDTVERAKVAAKLLEIAGRADIPIGIGLRENIGRTSQSSWVDGYELSTYPGGIIDDGVGALIETLMKASEKITLICIGPLTNISAALQREPHIADKARFVGMQGSIKRSHDGAEYAIAEWNVQRDIPAAKRVFTAPWDMTITPLDTCGLVRLKSEKYQAICNSSDPVTQAVIENYHIWLGGGPDNGQSSILFDTVAIYLAFADDLLAMQQPNLEISDDGFTKQSENGKLINIALDWKDLDAFEDLLIARLHGKI